MPGTGSVIATPAAVELLCLVCSYGFNTVRVPTCSHEKHFLPGISREVAVSERGVCEAAYGEQVLVASCSEVVRIRAAAEMSTL